ncbi:MAG TPA: DUF2975 domain-containing protein [Pseudolabrys sp.]|nr:DUF2975 domain-containing protein [Pseudolabrys sp.]
MAIAVTLGMIALVALVALIFFVPAVTRAAIGPLTMPFGLTEITPRARMFGFLVLLPPLALFLLGLNEIRRLFLQYAGGDVLSSAAARRLKRIAWLTVLGALIRAPARALLFLALSVDQAGVPQRSLFRVLPADFTFLLFGLLLLAIAWAMTEAARIAEEHRQIV